MTSLSILPPRAWRLRALLCVVLPALITSGCRAETTPPTQKFVIMGHLYSAYEMIVWWRTIKTEWDTANIDFPIEWFSRTTASVKPHEPGWTENMLVLPSTRFDRITGTIQKIKPDAVFVLGDIAMNHNAQEWDVINSHRKRSGVPWYFAPGNHDLCLDTLRGEYLKHVGYDSKNLKFGECVFILIRPETWEHDEKNLSEQAIQQIREGLDITARHHFLMMHHHYFLRRTSNWHTVVAPLISGKIKYVFYGNHYPGEYKTWIDEKNGIEHVSIAFWTDLEGRPLSERSHPDDKDDRVVVLTVRGDSVSYEAVRTKGSD